MKKLLYLVLFIVPVSSWAQQLTGKILDVESNPIPSANIFLHRTEDHAHSNVAGKFVMEGVQKGDVLFISSIGYKGKSVVEESVSKKFTGGNC